MRPPEPIPDAVASLRFPSGETLSLGGSSGFRLQSINEKAIVVERSGKTWSVPLTDIAFIRFSDAP